MPTMNAINTLMIALLSRATAPPMARDPRVTQSPGVRRPVFQQRAGRSGNLHWHAHQVDAHGILPHETELAALLIQKAVWIVQIGARVGIRD